MPGYYITFDSARNPELTDQQGEGNDILNCIFFSLAIKRGGWFLNPQLGSRLHLLRKEKCLPRTETLLKDYVSEALQWLYDTGRISSHETVTQRVPSAGRINYTVSVVAANGELATYSNFARVV